MCVFSGIDKLERKFSFLISDTEDRLKDQLAYDVAATSQEAFEQIFFQYTESYIKEYSNIPIILVGGCALNIILNSKVKL